MPRTERRWNPVEQEWLYNVPSRAAVPARVDMSHEERVRNCPFCPTSPEMPNSFDIHVLSSRFPFLEFPDGEDESGGHPHHRVYVYTSEHGLRLAELGVERASQVIDMLARETESLYADETIESVYVFEVFGDHFGPTVDHAHGQIVGLPHVPRRLSVDADCSTCLLDDPFWETDAVIATIPRHARYPFEALIAPKAHAGRLAEIDPTTRRHLAEALVRTFDGYTRYHGSLPPYVLSIVQSPRQERELGHVRFEVLPLHSVDGRLKRPGGLEVGLGLYTNPLDDAMARSIMAELLRD